MPWVRLDDQYRTNLKVLAIGPAGVALDIAGICFCSANLTDGFIPDAAVTSLYPVGNVKRTVETLVAQGRWSRDDKRGGYWIHDYLTYNPSRGKVLAEREKQRKKKEAQRRGESGQYQGESPGDNRGDASGESPPSRPLPDLPDVVSSSSSTKSVGRRPAEEEDEAYAEAKRRLANRPAHLPPVNDQRRWLANVAADIRGNPPEDIRPPLRVVKPTCEDPRCVNGWLTNEDGDPFDFCLECHPERRTA